MVRMEDKAWPVTVVPGDEHERRQTTGLLFQRMGWSQEKLIPSQRADIERQLDFWYDAEYCARALLTCLNQKPDKTLQDPREAGELLPDYLRSRMKEWYSKDEEGSSPLWWCSAALSFSGVVRR
ncbi:hypothetical protein GCM10022222_85750 [Amycolatopsis ultiminotia]|uniref:Uncharacterized protein n=1 Tax=Amycolatopsis ultiminotia TaxID=543629 RepID=A0ABP6YRP2_9PSEU